MMAMSLIHNHYDANNYVVIWLLRRRAVANFVLLCIRHGLRPSVATQ